MCQNVKNVLTGNLKFEFCVICPMSKIALCKSEIVCVICQNVKTCTKENDLNNQLCVICQMSKSQTGWLVDENQKKINFFVFG